MRDTGTTWRIPSAAREWGYGMNLFYKAYCRAVQGVFRLMMPLLPYRDPKILHSTRDVPKTLRESGVDSVLIVTGEVLFSLGAHEALVQALDEAGIRYSIYHHTVANPTVKNVEEARRAYLDGHCNGIIGFGGGSPIDCAKAVGARIARPKMTVSRMRGVLRIRKKTPYFVAIPTTAGSGSEVTPAAVITDEKTHRKFPITDFALIPDCAVLDAEHTRGLPKRTTASTGMDAMTHAVEAYIGNATTKQTRADALLAVQRISTYLERAWENGDDMEAREAMLEASFLAGRAFSKSYVGYCHAVAHTLGGAYNLPHGLANAVLLPHVLLSYGDKVHQKLKELAIAAGVADSDVAADVAAKAFINRLFEMNRHMDIPATLTGICREDIPKLSRLAAREGNPLYPVPVLMDADALAGIYESVM